MDNVGDRVWLTDNVGGDVLYYVLSVRKPGTMPTAAERTEPGNCRLPGNNSFLAHGLAGRRQPLMCWLSQPVEGVTR